MKSLLRLLREGNPTAIGILLAALVVGTFLPCLHYNFVNFDDSVYAYENTHVVQGLTWRNLGWAFSTLEGGFWHPLTWLSLLMDHQLFGGRSAGYHLTNLLLHAANTVLLFLLLRRLTGATWRSALVAALFAVHPLHVEPVVWIASRKDVLSTFFFMLTLWAYARYAERAVVSNRWSVISSPQAKQQAQRTTDQASRFTFHVSRYYLLSLLFFICGLMSKTMVVTLPFILLLLDGWPLRRFQLKTQGLRFGTLLPLCLEKAPYLAASLACGLLTIRAEEGVGAMRAVTDVPALYRLANSTLGCCRYIILMVWPHGLAVFYPYPRTFSLWPGLAAGLVLLAVSALVLWAGRRRPYLAFGWLWYGITLAPVSGLIQVGSHSHADRYTYVPLIGLFIMLVWGACDFASHWPRQRIALFAAAGMVLILLVCLARQQLGYWKDSEALFRHALAVTPPNAFAYNSLGLARLQKGDPDEAISYFKKAVDSEPDYARPRNNLGIALLEKGRTDEAIAEFQTALEHGHDSAEVSYNLGVAFLRKGEPQRAVAPFKRAVESRPDLTKARYGLGSALLRTGQTGAAIAQFRRLLELDPGNAEAHNDLGLALLRQGQTDAGIRQFRQALQIRPDSAEAFYNLGMSLLQKGLPDEAIPPLQQAVAIQPNLMEAQTDLARALLHAGKVTDAIAHYQNVVRANPKLAAVQNDLASALLERGQVEGALEHYQAAISVEPGNALFLNNLAWVLATSPDHAIRNGPRAVDLAEKANQVSGGSNSAILGTLAAAYAETGRLAEALATAQRALALAKAQTNTAQITALEQQIGLYEAGSPFRESNQTSPASRE